MVFEILEHQSNVENSNACSFFLKDLADANEASVVQQTIIISNEIVDLLRDGEKKERLLPNFSLPPVSLKLRQLYACVARESQKVVQGKGSTKSDPHWIDVDMCVLRLRNVETDFLITLSIPRKEIGEEDVGGEGPSSVFMDILNSFNVKDWSLFG